MRADTGVGPSMASGSHTYSGSWADFPTAPRNSRSAIAVAVVWLRVPAWPSTLEYWRDPNVANMRNIASMKPMSHTRLVTNAFFPALAAVSRANQNEMRKYEAATADQQEGEPGQGQQRDEPDDLEHGLAIPAGRRRRRQWRRGAGGRSPR